MKLNKRKIFVMAVAVCLVAILSFSTLAWFTAEDEITNKFNFADSDDDGQVDFSVDVTETGDDEDDGLVFDEILPGDVYDKDPTITNTSSSDRYSQYVRVTLTLKDPTGAWKAAFDAKRIGAREGSRDPQVNYLLGEMFQTVSTCSYLGSNDGLWYIGDKGYNETEGEEGFYWVFYYNGILAKDESVTLFEKVTIPTGLTVEDANAMGNTFEIDVYAEAVQSENLPISPANAMKAFELVKGE